MNIQTVSSTQYIDMINAEAHPDSKYFKAEFCQLGNQVYVRLQSGAGNWVSELIPNQDTIDKTVEEQLLELEKDLKAKHEALLKSFRPSSDVFAPLNEPTFK